jgi:hypothetical protein
MNENEHTDNPDMFGINRTNYLVWLNPQISPEQLERQQEIARTMSRMIAERYWQELHHLREKNG